MTSSSNIWTCFPLTIFTTAALPICITCALWTTAGLWVHQDVLLRHDHVPLLLPRGVQQIPSRQNLVIMCYFKIHLFSHNIAIRQLKMKNSYCTIMNSCRSKCRGGHRGGYGPSSTPCGFQGVLTHSTGCLKISDRFAWIKVSSPCGKTCVRPCLNAIFWRLYTKMTQKDVKKSFKSKCLTRTYKKQDISRALGLEELTSQRLKVPPLRGERKTVPNCCRDKTTVCFNRIETMIRRHHAIELILILGQAQVKIQKAPVTLLSPKVEVPGLLWIFFFWTFQRCP